MKWWFSLLFIGACAQASNVKINLYSIKVMDIEIPIQSILPYCTIPGDPEKKNSWLGIYIFYNKKIERLSERRQRLPKDCEKYKAELEGLLKQSKRARVIGVESSGFLEDADLAIILKDPTIKSVDGSWIFSRVITDKGCFGWQEGCMEPKLVEKEWYSNLNERF